MTDFVPPKYDENAFNCPHCGAFSQQDWSQVYHQAYSYVRWALCKVCSRVSVWVNGDMYYPITSTAPLPHPDMPVNVTSIYEEARSVLGQSPRASSALLRLAIEELVDYLEADGDNLFQKIGDLSRKGMPEGLVRALDIGRVIGNQAVHPGQIDFNDTTETANRLFNMVNLIVENQITIPNEIEALYNNQLTNGQKEAIEKRDGTEEG